MKKIWGDDIYKNLKIFNHCIGMIVLILLFWNCFMLLDKANEQLCESSILSSAVVLRSRTFHVERRSYKIVNNK